MEAKGQSTIDTFGVEWDFWSVKQLKNFDDNLFLFVLDWSARIGAECIMWLVSLVNKE